MVIELWPAIRASVHASQPDSPRRVRNVWRRLYRTNGRTLLNRSALQCCFFRLEASKWPLWVGAGHTHPSAGFPALSQRPSRIPLTRGVIGSTRRAAAVFPCVTSIVPFRPLNQVTDSQRRRKHSSGRNPESTRTPATAASGSEQPRGTSLLRER